MNFYQYRGPKGVEFWVAAESQEAADALVSSGNFTAVNLSGVLRSMLQSSPPPPPPSPDHKGFLHRHPAKEKELLGEDIEGHVVVDKIDWEIARASIPCSDTRCFQRK